MNDIKKIRKMLKNIKPGTSRIIGKVTITHMHIFVPWVIETAGTNHRWFGNSSESTAKFLKSKI